MGRRERRVRSKALVGRRERSEDGLGTAFIMIGFDHRGISDRTGSMDRRERRGLASKRASTG